MRAGRGIAVGVTIAAAVGAWTLGKKVGQKVAKVTVSEWRPPWADEAGESVDAVEVNQMVVRRNSR